MSEPTSERLAVIVLVQDAKNGQADDVERVVASILTRYGGNVFVVECPEEAMLEYGRWERQASGSQYRAIHQISYASPEDLLPRRGRAKAPPPAAETAGLQPCAPDQHRIQLVGNAVKCLTCGLLVVGAAAAQVWNATPPDRRVTGRV